MGLLSSLLVVVLLSMAGPLAIGVQAASDLASEDLMVPTGDAGIELYLRNKHPDDMASFDPAHSLLFVHGATYPSEATFDLPFDDVSWMDYIAGRGFDVYLLDIRGYGRSTRPPEMDQPADANGPIVDTKTAIRDIGTAIDFILERRGIERLNLMGWSWGTTTTAGYTADHPDKVRRLVLYAPIWVADPPRTEGQTFNAYRTIARQAAKDRWLRGVPEDKRADLIPAGVFDAWWAALLRSDPVGARQDPPVIRAPNGVLDDIVNQWLMGKPLYDPAKITVPTIIVLGEWDQDTPPAMAQTLFPLLTNAPDKRLVMIGEGTHSLMLEKNRMTLFTAVQSFLEKGAATD